MILEADFCALEVPDGWLSHGPQRFAASSEAEALAGEVEETWLESGAPPIDAYLEERKAFLGRCYEAFAVVAEGPVEAGSPRALGFTARFENDDFQPIVQREVVLTEGPVRCSLRLAGPEDAPDREALFERIVHSFQLTLGRSLGNTERLSLFAEPEHSLITDERLAAEPFPLLCHQMVIPQGWAARTEGREVVLEGGRVEVRAFRLLGEAREPGHWMVERLEELRTAGGHLLATGQGETPRGAWTALWSELGGRTWRSAATQRQLTLRLSTAEPLEFTLRGPLRHASEAEPILGSLIAGIEPLPPEEWKTLPLEPWIDLELEGPWTCTHPGLYIHPELFIPVLELRRQEGAPPLDTLKSSLHETMRQGAGVLPGSDTETAEMGHFRGRQAWRYSADAQLNVRGIWIEDGPKLTSCLLQVRDADSSEALFQKILEGLRLSERQK